MDNRYSLFYYLIVIAVLVTGTFGLYAIMQVSNPYSSNGKNLASIIISVPGIKNLPGIEQPVLSDDSIKPFASAEEFIAYLDKGESLGAFGGAVMMRAETMGAPAPMMAMNDAVFATQESAGLGFGGGSDIDRVSETNVQVAGIDEPDIVKTDGQEIYVSSPNYWVGVPGPIPFNQEMLRADVAVESSIVPPRNYGGVHSINAFPPADLALDSTIDTSGDLLLYDDTLVVLSGNTITGYDVSNPETPSDSWGIELKDNSWLIDSRLIDNTLYLVSRTWVNRQIPCPLRPLIANGKEISIPCGEIYHPVIPAPIDSTFTIYEVNVETGSVSDSTSFVGSSGQSIVYASHNAFYLTYPQQMDQLSLVTDFFKQNRDLVPAWLITRLVNLDNIDISSPAKMTELSVIMQEWQQTLDQDEMLKLQNELENRAESFLESRGRDIQRTGIAKIMLDGLTVSATGSVPGSPLNQFALDEYEGNLRVATTIGQNGVSLGIYYARGESVSDVTILDSSLNQISAVKDLGRDERIYAVRFIADKGYVVTFKQIDPFFVLDLSDPKKPELKGELKIPGFSSYLHPLSDNLIVGIGREDSQVKISLFDVSNPSSPQEADTYRLNEYWSEIQNTHHAFLLDDKYSVFFMPGGQGGYVFSYANNTLSLEKAVSGIQARRALFINDYLYVIGENNLVVLNEADWTRVNEISY